VPDRVGAKGRGGQAIGRQIVLPFSKAFEIAWKGIRIRLWRSLITMSGIVLAIAFLMSVWTASVFSQALRAVPESNELYPIVQGAVEAEAIATGAVRIRCTVVEEGTERTAGIVTPAASIEGFLNSQEAFGAEPMAPDAASLQKCLTAPKETRPAVLIMSGLPPALADADIGGAIESFVREGGFLLVYGTAGMEAGAPKQLAGVLPATVQEGDFSAGSGSAGSGAEIARGPKAVQILWRNHPSALFRNTAGKPDAEALAAAGARAVAWTWKLGEGAVTWYTVEPASAADANVITWFVRGQGIEGGAEAERAGGSPLVRLIARGAGGVGPHRDMRGIWLVTLSLMVSVVGITNAMLMSVTERFREIGTMKCLGALDKFVVKLFLIESSLQGVAGSVVGAIIGFLLAFVRALFTFHVKDVESGQSYWLALRFFPALSLLEWMGVALLVGIVLSIIAAIYPAIRAARMEPVQAMRVEA
jgi:hypothetical protein